MVSTRDIIDFVSSIFIDDVVSSQDSIQTEIHSLLLHYQEELDECFLDDIIVATKYKDTKYLIERYKYNSEREYLSSLSGCYIDIYRQQVRQMEHNSDWVIVPVPMHWSRYILRGFDHMYLLALSTSKKITIPFKKLLKTTYRPRQSQLNRGSRLANKENAFRIRSGFSSIPKQVILLDDVVSSGATANACAKVLKDAGVERVVAWFIASNN